MSSKKKESKDNNKALRDHILNLMRGGDAHIEFQSVVDDFPINAINTKVPGIPYSAWDVIEHMRIAQWDILEFSRNGKHVSPKWPEGYWPPEDKSATIENWHQSIDALSKNLKEMEELIEDSKTDLFQPIPHGNGQTLLREALLVADHNAYHLGVLVTLKRLLSSGQGSGVSGR